MKKPPLSWLAIPGVFIGCAAGFLWLCRYTPAGYPFFFDEGSAIHAAHRISRGQELYRDLYYFKSPLSYYLLAGLFKLFGPSLLVARSAGAVILALLLSLSCQLSVRLSGPQRKNPGAWLFLRPLPFSFPLPPKESPGTTPGWPPFLPWGRFLPICRAKKPPAPT